MTNQYTDDPNYSPGNTRLIIGLALMILFPVALSTLLWQLRLTDFELMLYSRFIFWGEVMILYLYAIQIERQPFLPWAEEYPLQFYFKWAVYLYLLSAAASIISALPIALGWHDNAAILQRWLNVIVPRYWLLIFCALTAGITEELIIRGYLIPRLAQLFRNQYLAVIISSVIFSAMHYRYFSLRETLFTFLIGMIFGVHYQRYRNIHVLIAVHFMIDFIAFLFARYRFEHLPHHAFLFF